MPAVATHTGTSFEEEAFAAEETHVMHESVALRTALPASPEQGGATGQDPMADSAVFGLNAQQEGLPFSGGFPDTHGEAV